MFDEAKNTKSILTWLICIAYIGMFFPIQVSNITLGALLLWGVIKFNLNSEIKSFRQNKLLHIIVALFLIQMIGLLYTTNLQNGLFVLEKKIAILLVPVLILPHLMNDHKIRKVTLRSIGLITIGSSLILLSIAFVKYFVLNSTTAFHYEEFTQIHYVYFALYFGCGSLILLDDLLQRHKGPLIIFIVFFYSLAILVFIASKTGILAFIVGSIVLLYFRIPNGKLFAVSILILILSTATALYFNKTTRERFVGLNHHLSIVLMDDFQGKQIEVTDLNMRLLFWKIGVTNLWRDHLFLIGTGTGDAQDYIDSLYKKPQYDLHGYIGWDSHNEWVFTLIQLGLIGLIFLGFFYGQLCMQAIRHKDVQLICFLIISISFTMSESILESNKGIVFTALMVTVLGASPSTQIDKTDRVVINK